MFLLKYKPLEKEIPAYVMFNGECKKKFASKEEAKAILDTSEEIFIEYPNNSEPMKKTLNSVVLSHINIVDDGNMYSEL
jgi:hypothetical protein